MAQTDGRDHLLSTPGAGSSSLPVIEGPQRGRVLAKREEILTARRKELSQALDHHDDLVREAFHLQKFVSLVHYDPKVAKEDKSTVFEEFRASYDLLKTVPLATTSTPGSRRTRGVMSNQRELLASPSISKIPSSRVPNLGAKRSKAATMHGSPIKSLSKQTPSRKGAPLRHAPSSSTPLPPPAPPQSPGSPSLTIRRAPNLRGGPMTPKRGIFGAAKRYGYPSSPYITNTPKAGTKHQAGEPPPETPRIKRIKLVHRPWLEYSDPEQFPPPPSFNRSIPSFLSSFHHVDEDAEVPATQVDRLEAKANEDARKRNKIESLRKAGVFQTIEQKVDVTPPVEPKRTRDHMDYLIAHASQVGKRIKDEGKAKVSGARRIAKMIEKYFEHVAGADSRQQRAADRERAALVKRTLKKVVEEWKLAVTVIRAKKKDEQKAEQIRRGKQHLDAFLEQSTQVLEAQHSELVAGARARQSRSRSRSERSNSRSSASGRSESPHSSMDGWSLREEQSQLVDSDDETNPELDGQLEEEESEVEASLVLDEDDDDVEVQEASLESRARLGSPTGLMLAASSTSQKAPSPTYLNPTRTGSTTSPHAKRSVSAEPRVLVFQDSESEFVDDSLEEMRRVVLHLTDVEMSDGDTEGQSSSSEAEDVPAENMGSPAPRLNEHLTKESRSEGSHNESGHQTRGPSMEPSPDRAENTIITPRPAVITEPEVADGDAEFEADDEKAMELQNADHELDVEMEAEEAEVDSDDGEIDGLGKDAEIPLEELLRQYGYIVPDEEEQQPISPEEPETGQGSGPSQMDVSFPSAPTSPISSSPAKGSNNYNEDIIKNIDLPEGSDTEEPTSAVHSSADDEDTGSEDSENDILVPPPFLLRGTLRPYQQAGLEWLASLYANNTNGILADEMGLGKTIQTIALLGWLACSRGIWGPHLVIVPTSVLLNWEMEFKRFLPGFKTIPYYGTQKERRERRTGWSNPYAFNVCITSYQIALADHHVFRKKKWIYMVLDEAHNIKNFKSKRWETLLCFNAERRLLLTGTPLQNNLMELWSLLYFLMPDEGETQSFLRREDFKDLFQNPVERAIEDGGALSGRTSDTVLRLHKLLRPYLLRRLKSEVEKQLPKKYEHLVYCPLSKRQRFLYDEFMSRAATRETLASGNFISVINCLMQLRKVCNHPDLFEVRPIVTSFALNKSAIADFEIKDLLVRRRLLQTDSLDELDLGLLGLQFSAVQGSSYFAARSTRRLDASQRFPHISEHLGEPPPRDTRTIAGYKLYYEYQERRMLAERWQHLAYVNHLRCQRLPVYSRELLNKVQALSSPLLPWAVVQDDRRGYLERVDTIPKMIRSYADRAKASSDIIEHFACITPTVVVRDMPSLALSSCPSYILHGLALNVELDAPLHHSAVKLQIGFPEPSLLQYDCGKLQELQILLRERKAGGHRVLIFTQMTKVLDILEIFLNFHGYRYLRLDGATKVEQRQIITERFNVDSRVFAFIASSRSGGVGINLTGADTVIFYDSDYNPSMDRQCEDRAHRIGQTREVHIYRFISKHTIEESMLRKANQKRLLDETVIQQGGFDWRRILVNDYEMERALAQVEDTEDVEAARIAAAEIDLDRTEFNERATESALRPAATSHLPEIEDEVEVEEGQDDGIGSIAEYMLRAVERDWDYFGYRRPYTLK